jgi:hypothetical protein
MQHAGEAAGLSRRRSARQQVDRVNRGMAPSLCQAGSASLKPSASLPFSQPLESAPCCCQPECGQLVCRLRSSGMATGRRAFDHLVLASAAGSQKVNNEVDTASGRSCSKLDTAVGMEPSRDLTLHDLSVSDLAVRLGNRPSRITRGRYAAGLRPSQRPSDAPPRAPPADRWHRRRPRISRSCGRCLSQKD